MFLRLRQVCQSRGVTLSQLAGWTGIARVSLSRYAHGVQDISLAQLLKVTSALGCRLADIVDEREDLTGGAWRQALREQMNDPAQKGDKSWVPRALLAYRRAHARGFREAA